MDCSFHENLIFALHQRFGSKYADKLLADALGVDRSTASRLRNTRSLPSRRRLDALCRMFGIDIDMWSLPHTEFVQRHREAGTPAYDPLVSRRVQFKAIEANRHRWHQSYAIHRGQYVCYWKAKDLDGSYVASLVEIHAIDHGGMRFRLMNPYIREDLEQDQIRIWQYDGVAYPVSEYLYFFAEQDGNDYEILSMILTASPIAPPDLLRGCLTGIYVKDGTKHVAVNMLVVLSFLKTAFTDWRGEFGHRLGKIPAGKVPERIRRMINSYPGVIALT